MPGPANPLSGAQRQRQPRNRLILAQSRVPVLPGDTLKTLRARVMAVEGPLLVGALTALGRATVNANSLT